MDKKILLVDDEKDFTELTGTLLSFHDLDVDTFNDPQNMEEVITKQHYDLIVTDLMMPHMNGFQFIDLLRQKTRYKKTPIIVLSAKTLTDAERKALMNHEVRFLTKPFEPQGLVDEIQQLLEEK